MCTPVLIGAAHRHPKPSVQISSADSASSHWSLLSLPSPIAPDGKALTHLPVTQVRNLALSKATLSHITTYYSLKLIKEDNLGDTSKPSPALHEVNSIHVEAAMWGLFKMGANLTLEGSTLMTH